MTSGQRVPILVYHHVYPDEEAARAGPVAGVIGASEFDRQMQFVCEDGWRVVSTSAVVDWLAGDADLPHRACVLHFDNGWLDTFTVVLPRLRELRLTATCFPVTAGVDAATHGDSMRLRTLTEGNVTKPFMTWDQVAALKDDGWEIGAHTHTHCKMSGRHDAEGDGGVLREVDESHRLFAQHLAAAPVHFAYPSGARSDRTDALLRERYRSLRLWRWYWPIRWHYTDRATPTSAIECQNVDARVPFDQFQRIFREAADEN